MGLVLLGLRSTAEKFWHCFTEATASSLPKVKYRMNEQTETSRELPILLHWTEFLKWLLHTTEKFPKKTRFTFVSRIDNLALDVLERIIEARYSKDRDGILNRANLQLDKIRILLRICHDLGYLPNRSYEYASRCLVEVGKMLGGWRKSGKVTQCS